MDTVRVALITGGGSGIGTAIARDLLDHGWAVVLTGRRQDRLDRAADELDAPERVLTLSGDAAESAAVHGWVTSAVERFGRLDAAIANAGYAVGGWLDDGDNADEWRDMLLTNVLGPALLMHHARPALAASAGRVVLIGSVAGLVPTSRNLYGVTKHAVNALAHNARLALTNEHIGCTLINPGRVETPFWDDLGGVPDGPILAASDLARAVSHALLQPAGVDVNEITVRPFESAV